MIHHELARPPENLMVHREGRPHRETRVPRRRLNIDTLKRRAIENLPIREAVECDATRQTQRLLPGFLRQCGSQNRKKKAGQARASDSLRAKSYRRPAVDA